MTFFELYVLNSAIDGEYIYSIPEFSANRLSLVTVELIKDSLIKKGYLEDYEMLTELGTLEIRKIKQFKEAKKYISIFDMVIGCVDRKKGILLKCNKDRDYSLSAIDLTQGKKILLETFSELFNEREIIGMERKEDIYVTARKLLTDYPINVKTSFTIKTDNLTEEENNTKELFFESSGKKYYYDCMKNILHERCGKDLAELLQERMEVV